jgi:hypothetical protein
MSEKTETPKSATALKDEEKKWIQEVLNSKRKAEESLLEYSLKLTKDLKKYMHGKTNMHSEAKLLVTKVLDTHNAVKLEVEKYGMDMKKWQDDAKEIIEEKRQQVKDLQQELKDLKDNLKKSVGSQPTKRKPTSPATSETTATPKRHKSKSNTENDPTATPKISEGWQQIRRRKKPPDKKKPQGPKTIREKADALVIGVKEESSYAGILKKMKNDESLKEFGSHVTRIQRTRNGEILLQFKKDDTTRGSGYQELIKGVLGEDVTVKALSQQVSMECKNLDEETTADEVREVLTKEFSSKDPDGIGTIKMRSTYGKMQAGSFKVPAAIANKMIEAGKVTVGWSVCRLQKSQQLLRCYKCLGFNHIAKHCKAENDRSKACWKCGLDGHKAKTCKNAAKCLLCTGNEGNDHATGSSKCKSYREAALKRS